MYFLLTAHVEDLKLAELNAQYLGDILTLLTAADWAQSPAPQSTCSVDLNSDLLPDCILANEKFFAVFETDGGRLSYLFSRCNSFRSSSHKRSGLPPLLRAHGYWPDRLLPQTFQIRSFLRISITVDTPHCLAMAVTFPHQWAKSIHH
jgi:hypothetical protein